MLRTSQRGQKQLLSDEDKQRIRECIDQKPDVTINEIREQLGLTVNCLMLFGVSFHLFSQPTVCIGSLRMAIAIFSRTAINIFLNLNNDALSPLL